MAKKRSSKRRSPWLRGYYDEFEFWTEHDVVRTVQSVRRWSGPRSGLLAIGVGHPVPQDDSLIPRSIAIYAADAVLSRASSTALRQNFGRIRCRHLDSLQAISAITEQVSGERPGRADQPGADPAEQPPTTSKRCDRRQTAVSRLHDQPDCPMVKFSSTEKANLCAR